MGVLEGKYILQTVVGISTPQKIKDKSPILPIQNSTKQYPLVGNTLYLVDLTGLAYNIKVNYRQSLLYYSEIQGTATVKPNLPPQEDLHKLVLADSVFKLSHRDFSQKYLFNFEKPTENLLLTPFLELIMNNIFEKVKRSIKNRDHASIIFFIDRGRVGIKERERIKRRKRIQDAKPPSFLLKTEDETDCENVVTIHDILKFIHEKIPIFTLLNYMLQQNNIKKLCSHLELETISVADFRNNEADVDMNRFASCVENVYTNNEYFLDDQRQELNLKEIKTYTVVDESLITCRVYSWIDYIKDNLRELNNIVFMGIDIDMPFFYLISRAYHRMMKNNSILNFYVMQFTSIFLDPDTKTQCDAYWYKLNDLSLESLNGITAMAVMLLAGSDYADGCFSTAKSAHFYRYLCTMVNLSKNMCICIDKLDNIDELEDFQECNNCGYRIFKRVNKNVHLLLVLMSKRSVGNMPLFKIDDWYNSKGNCVSSRMWSIPFISIALITTIMVSTNIHNEFRSKGGKFTNLNIKIESDFIYIWFELLYFIFNYLNSSNKYLCLLEKAPLAHSHGISTKKLLYHTANFLKCKYDLSRSPPPSLLVASQ